MLPTKGRALANAPMTWLVTSLQSWQYTCEFLQLIISGISGTLTGWQQAQQEKLDA